MQSVPAPIAEAEMEAYRKGNEYILTGSEVDCVNVGESYNEEQSSRYI